jgi:hypothetical protein
VPRIPVGPLAISLYSLLVVLVPNAHSASDPDLESWFNSPPDKGARDVNEGTLTFLATRPEKPVHYHHNSLTITDASLRDGWVKLRQCHENIDRVPSAQIVFQRERIRALGVQSYSGIGKVWVEGPTVQLKDVGPDAKLCISAESRALTNNGDGTYSLRNGPYMRRFLDGYYPMHVSADVKWTTSKLQFENISPPVQPGFKVLRRRGEISFDAWFEGRLNTVITFRSIN